jgi:hypothetical protein
MTLGLRLPSQHKALDLYVTVAYLISKTLYLGTGKIAFTRENVQ